MGSSTVFGTVYALRDLHRRGFNLDVILIALINQPAAPCVLVDACIIRRTGCVAEEISGTGEHLT